MHSWASPISVVLGLIIVLSAPDTRSRIATIIFVLSVVTMFTVSASFHRRQWSDLGWWRMRQLDMTAIYLLIAGSYTGIVEPVMSEPWRTRLLLAVWLGAAAGIVIRWLPIVPPFGLTTAIYVVVGSVLIPALDELHEGVGTTGVVLILGGCLLYLFGALMLGARWPNPRPGVFGYHEVWHIWVTIAAFMHYAVSYFVVLPRAAELAG